LLIGALLLSSGLLTACDSASNDQEAQASVAETPAPAAPTPRRTNVATVMIEPQTLAHRIEFVGKLYPNERVQVHSELPGILEQVGFEEGNSVRKDQVMANVSTKELTVRRDMARADFQLAETTLQRHQQLAVKQLVSQAQLDQTRTQRQVARYNWDLAEVQLNKSVVRAPIAGVVKTKAVNAGEYIGGGKLIAEILDLSQMRVQIDVPEQDITQLRRGQDVQVELYVEPNTRYPGKIHKIGVEADARSRTFPVEVLMQNPEQRFRAGMLARVTIDLGEFDTELVIPRNAIIERETERIVYVAEEGRAVRRVIKTGIRDNDRVQVTAGLQAGEALIVEGHTRLVNNELINVTRTDS
jgi:membrane fusion protein (multidrug efflux system)